jgi:hypothetical protein
MPARRKGRIELHGAPIRGNRGGRISERPVAVAPLLKQPTVVRVNRLESGQRGERVGDATQIPLADRDHVQNIAVLRHVRE